MCKSARSILLLDKLTARCPIKFSNNSIKVALINCLVTLTQVISHSPSSRCFLLHENGDNLTRHRFRSIKTSVIIRLGDVASCGRGETSWAASGRFKHNPFALMFEGLKWHLAEQLLALGLCTHWSSFPLFIHYSFQHFQLKVKSKAQTSPDLHSNWGLL